MRCLPRLTEGNSKLGKIHNWSIPAVSEICIAATKSCCSACYAKTGFYYKKEVQELHKNNYIASLSDSFSSEMISSIQRKRIRLVRIHTSGEFYSDKYIKKWIEIVSACPNTRFFVYTRVWRKPHLFSYLKTLNNLKNITLWCSIDIDSFKEWTDTLASTFHNVAVMLNNLDESFICDEVNATVAFLVTKRKQIVKKIGSTIVCPKENGITHEITCTKCKICWDWNTLQKVKSKLCSAPSEST